MGNIVKFSTPVSVNSIKSGGFNIGVNATPADLTEFYTGICPINGGYTIYINKASNGPSIYAPQNDTDLVNITKILGGNVSTVAEALVWINSQSNMTVTNTNYPSIVTNGLVINLDAGFVSSYPKGGTEWKDLSGNGINGNLINGVSYNSVNGGSLVFDGTDDVCRFPANTFTTGSPQNGTFIIDMTFPVLNTSVSTILFSDGGTTNNLIYLYRNTNFAVNSYSWLIYTNVGARLLGGTYSPGERYQVAYTFDSLGNVAAYRDGALINSSTWPAGSTSWNRVGTLIPFVRPSSPGNTGSISSFMYYNRALSAAEILQNYYADLERLIPTNGLVLSLDAQNTNLYATSPTTAYDISGNGNNGTLINGVQYVGDADGSWRFDGINDHINIPYSSYWDNNVFGNATNFTISCWAKCSSFYNWTCLIQKSPNSGFYSESEGAAIWVNASGFQGVFGNGSPSNPPGYGNIWSYSTTDTNSWFHLLFTGDGTNGRFYVNGVLVIVQPLSRTISVVTSTNGPRFGIRGGGSFFSGRIGNVLLYTRALSQTEITTTFNATRARYGL